MDLKLKNKVIMVAAASKGLGYGIAEILAQEGAILSIASRTQQDIHRAAENLAQQYQATAKGYVFDASDTHSIQNWVQATIDTFGRLDGIVINAGGPPMGDFDDFDDTDWQKAFELTLMSAVRMVREVLPHMRKKKHGCILTITSSSVKEPIDVLLLSNVMRAGVTGLVKSLSQQLAKDNIRVNNIIPGYIATDRLKSIDQAIAQQKQISLEDQSKSIYATIPLGRYGQVHEFAKVAAFLLSDAAGYINGASVVVDGGKMKTVW